MNSTLKASFLIPKIYQKSFILEIKCPIVMPWTEEPGELQSMGSQSYSPWGRTRLSYWHLNSDGQPPLIISNVCVCVCVYGVPQWLSSKESACDAGIEGGMGLIPRWERSLGGGHGNPLQYSCLENPLDVGAWWATVHRVAKSQAWLKWLSTQHRTYMYIGHMCVHQYTPQHRSHTVHEEFAQGI